MYRYLVTFYTLVIVFNFNCAPKQISDLTSSSSNGGRGTEAFLRDNTIDNFDFDIELQTGTVTRKLTNDELKEKLKPFRDLKMTKSRHYKIESKMCNGLSVVKYKLKENWRECDITEQIFKSQRYDYGRPKQKRKKGVYFTEKIITTKKGDVIKIKYLNEYFAHYYEINGEKITLKKDNAVIFFEKYPPANFPSKKKIKKWSEVSDLFNDRRTQFNIAIQGCD